MLSGVAAQSARAENRVTVRGQYYREPSTRVIQPVAEMAADLPAGVDVNAHYLLDAITSASAASGPTGDNIFTEYRNESEITVGKNWERARVTLRYKYSAESDYWSHAFSAGLALRLWQDTATLAVSGGLGLDQVGRRAQGNAPVPTPVQGASCTPSAVTTCALNTVFAGVGYSQVLSPTDLVQAGYEVAVLNGYLASPYRGVSPYGMEKEPETRVRHALFMRAAHYLPDWGTGFQLQYRYYWDMTWKSSQPFHVIGSAFASDQGDPWLVRSHTVEGRVFQAIVHDLELRLTGRYYSQGPANFWCDQLRDTLCYDNARYYTSDPKLGPVRTIFIEGKVYWDARALRHLRVLGWFAAGTFELSYGTFFQSTSFKNAHVLQTAYSIPF